MLSVPSYFNRYPPVAIGLRTHTKCFLFFFSIPPNRSPGYVLHLPTHILMKVRDHFHSRYSLTVPDPSYPLLGVSTTGVAIFWASTLGVATGLLVTPSVVARTGVERHLVAAAIGPGCFFISVLSVFAVSKVCGVGEPRKRDTLQEKWEEGM